MLRPYAEAGGRFFGSDVLYTKAGSEDDPRPAGHARIFEGDKVKQTQDERRPQLINHPQREVGGMFAGVDHPSGQSEGEDQERDPERELDAGAKKIESFRVVPDSRPDPGGHPRFSC